MSINVTLDNLEAYTLVRALRAGARHAAWVESANLHLPALADRLESELKARTTPPVEIGYLCAKGHYCFHADPDEGGQCGSKNVGAITLTFEPELSQTERDQLLAEASEHLGEVFATWRECNCSEGEQP